MSAEEVILNGKINKGREPKVFDWCKAAKLIKDRNAILAIAGLSEDMAFTAGEIFNKEPIKDSYTYLASTWATPIIKIDGVEIPCYKMQSEVPDWGKHTVWPDEALAIISSQ